MPYDPILEVVDSKTTPTSHNKFYRPCSRLDAVPIFVEDIIVHIRPTTPMAHCLQTYCTAKGISPGSCYMCLDGRRVSELLTLHDYHLTPNTRISVRRS